MLDHCGGLSTDGGWVDGDDEYYRKQVEILLVWAMATTNPDVKAKLLARALGFLTLADCVDDDMLRVFQELFAAINAQLLHDP